ncbi:MAG: histidine kinase [Massilia sp.]
MTALLRAIPANLRQASWPWLPLLVLALLAIPPLRGLPYWTAWRIDISCMLVAFAVAASVRSLLQSVCMDKSILCWQAFAVAMFAGITAMGLLCQWYLPDAEMRMDFLDSHKTAYVAFVFMLAGLLPEEIRADLARRARQNLAQETARRLAETQKRQVLEARLSALQAQIEPHFLYNTLANAMALIDQDGPAAQSLLAHLIRFLRAAVPDLRSNHTSLGQELERAQAYLEIMKIRLGERLQFHIDASEQARACVIPPLSVMTLIENAIEHGIGPLSAGGQLRVDAVCLDGRLRIEVSDNGVGFQAEGGDGVGLANLSERLAVLYGEAAELAVSHGARGGIVARISLPLESAVATTAPVSA